jgi:hypothetical protein
VNGAAPLTRVEFRELDHAAFVRRRRGWPSTLLVSSAVLAAGLELERRGLGRVVLADEAPGHKPPWLAMFQVNDAGCALVA